MRSVEGSVYFSEDWGRWVARLRYTDAEGKRREKKRHCLTKRQASAMVRQLKEEASTTAVNLDRRTFRQLDQHYREKHLHKAVMVGGQKVSGFRQPVKAVAHYMDGALEFFRDKPLEDIRFSDLQAFKAATLARPTIQGRQRSIADTNQFLRRLRRTFAVAVEEGWIATNPFNRGSALIVASHETERERVLTREEEQRLIDACSGQRAHIRPLIIFALETGCRRGEILSLKWDSVNLEKRFIKIEGTNTKTLKSRLVPISSRLAEALRKVWENSPKRLTANVLPMGDFKKAYITATKIADLPDLHFHDLRHTAITRMLEKGLSPTLVMKASGHSQTKTFLRYVNQTETSVYEMAAKLDAA